MIMKFFDRKSCFVSSKIELFAVATVRWFDLNSHEIKNGFFECVKVINENLDQNSVPGNKLLFDLLSMISGDTFEQIEPIKTNKKSMKFFDKVEKYNVYRDDFIYDLDQYIETARSDIFLNANQFDQFEVRSVKVPVILVFMLRVFFLHSSNFIIQNEIKTDEAGVSDVLSYLNTNNLILKYRICLENFIVSYLPQMNFRTIEANSFNKGLFKKYLSQNLDKLSLLALEQNSIMNIIENSILVGLDAEFNRTTFYPALRILFEIHLSFAKYLLHSTIYPYFRAIMKSEIHIRKADFEFIREVLNSFEINFPAPKPFNNYTSETLYLSLVHAVIDEIEQILEDKNLL